ncbi:MAG: DUF3575 domain-containing protein, partial [Bacteroidota bacterium]|nr:DUF3575 domain-containing protein [Bacteroidota bacterium]
KFSKYSMKMRFRTCMFLVLLSPMLASAQLKTPTAYKNSVKLNLAGMALHNVSMLYERSLNEHWSLQLGAGYRWGGDIPKVFGLGGLIMTSNSQGVRGYSITPEIRYYFNFCECGGPGTGLYAGLYGRFTKLYGDLTFHYWSETEYIDVATAGNFRELGGGLQIGYQFKFKERFLVDFMFAGPRLASNKINFSIESDYVEELVPIIEDAINEKLEWLGMDPISLDPSTDLEANFGFKYFRYGIGFGILF